ncbi:family 16 glycosylhydrolase [Plantactinospora sp. B6F1]|uniref:family 16 glycosylhydrolase n=1 Tax=Plantactinospora sp. B6F1 TaxID=3158971 RepID=UPI0032D90FDC
MQKTRGWLSIFLGVTTAAMAPAVVGPVGSAQATSTAPSVQAAQTLTVQADADTTYTPVTADGDNGVKTTLASCPQSCEGNPDGERQPVLGFTVSGLPSTATNIRARLEVYTWTAATAGVTAYPASGGASGPGTWANRPTLGAALASTPSVVAGHNGFDVSRAVPGNGTFAFALRQQTPTTRTYWASREHANTAIRPRLVITYDTGSPWTLAWWDEFDGNSLDTSKWNARNNSYVDYDRACITSRPENVFVSGGLLTMRVRKEQYTCGGGGTRQYTTSYLATDRGKASFTYGRFEVRAKSPNGPTNSKGLWPAFWMRPDDGGTGEIDVVELPGGSQYYRAATQAIFYDYTPIKQDHRHTFATGYPGDGFHTYTTEWEPGVLRWYIDGVLVWQRDRTTTTWFDEVFNKPYHLRLNYQVGGWLGDPDATTVLPADFQVDYVRVYQRSGTS